jgi:hypothetical protein
MPSVRDIHFGGGMSCFGFVTNNSIDFCRFSAAAGTHPFFATGKSSLFEELLSAPSFASGRFLMKNCSMPPLIVVVLASAAQAFFFFVVLIDAMARHFASFIDVNMSMARKGPSLNENQRCKPHVYVGIKYEKRKSVSPPLFCVATSSISAAIL